MKYILLLVISISFLNSSCTLLSGNKSTRPADTASPLIVVNDHSYWTFAEGGTAPDFVLYSDGTLIYRKRDTGYKYFQEGLMGYTYYQVSLSNKEMATIQSWYVDRGLDSLKSFYRSTRATDDITSTIVFLSNDGQYHGVSVYGMSGYYEVPDGMYDIEGQKKMQKPPVSFVSVYDSVMQFEHPAAVPWKPDSITVVCTRWVNNSLLPPHDWPQSWYDSNTPYHRWDSRQGQAHMMSLHVPASMQDSIMAFLNTIYESSQHCIRIGGEEWQIGSILPAVPKEQIWIEFVMR